MRSPKTGITMNATECAQAMRKIGIPSSAKQICDGIQSGEFPFGRIISPEDSLKRNVRIFRVDFEAWLATKIPKEANA